MTFIHYCYDSRLAGFLPGHLRGAREVGIIIHSAGWADDGSAYVMVEGIDPNNPKHAAVGAQAGRRSGAEGGYRREEVTEIPGGLDPIEY